MRKRWLFALILLGLVIVGITFSNWFPILMEFVGANNETIQGLASLIQIIIWVGAAALTWFGLLPHKSGKTDQTIPIPVLDTPVSTATQEDKSVTIDGNVDRR
jgi:hypothetical protein